MSPILLIKLVHTYKATADHQVSRHSLWVHKEVLNLGEVDPPVSVEVEAKEAVAPLLHDGPVPEEQVEGDPEHLDKQELGER